MKNIAGLHTKVKNYSRLRPGALIGMMDKTMLNCAAVGKGTEHCKGILTYIYGVCNKGDVIVVSGFSQNLLIIHF